jgi:flagellar basal body rod protein FlgG
MDNYNIAIAAGLRARSESLDLVAHNLANASTAGFKADHELYQQYVGEEAYNPLGPETVSPVVEGHWTDLSQGALQYTRDPYHFALSGPGYFTIKGPSGPLYQRSGDFHLSKEGRLVTREGLEVDVRNASGQPVQIDHRQTLTVGADGSLRQGNAVIGRFFIADFSPGVSFEKKAGNYFSFSAPQPMEARNAEVHQGALEQSNVDPAKQAVRLMTVMRQFEMLTRALTIGGEMSKKAVDEVARVNG